MKIIFPQKTAKEIVDACDNKLGKGKLLYDTNWYKDEDFYTKEKCREGTFEVSDDIEHFGGTWDECASLTKKVGSPEMMNFPEMVYFIQEYYKATGKYPEENKYKGLWTISRSSGGSIVYVGRCDSNGVRVDRDKPGYSYSLLGVRFRSAVSATTGAKPEQGAAESCDLEARVAELERKMDSIHIDFN